MGQGQPKPWVYIACPYMIGDVAANVARSLEVWDILFGKHYVPINPLWTHLQHLYVQRTRDDWLSFGLDLLDRCDALLRLSGESAGADAECRWAATHGVPVFHSIEELDRWRAARAAEE